MARHNRALCGSFSGNECNNFQNILFFIVEIERLISWKNTHPSTNLSVVDSLSPSTPNLHLHTSTELYEIQRTAASVGTTSDTLLTDFSLSGLTEDFVWNSLSFVRESALPCWKTIVNAEALKWLDFVVLMSVLDDVVNEDIECDTWKDNKTQAWTTLVHYKTDVQYT